ncbi:hypothetical protein NPIL_162551 [Nephila pilipes]|uniref:Uncharacterized protein n=1 Tax=Nephila pilipes TaxID=299642 RepID=A0A8X6PHB2_NEPPI|nr:hypothetical protein NPIL_162551 [Nephila pilipes]
MSNGFDDINIRFLNSLCCVGKGNSGAKTFCAIKNLPPPPAKFERYNDSFLSSQIKTIHPQFKKMCVFTRGGGSIKEHSLRERVSYSSALSNNVLPSSQCGHTCSDDDPFKPFNHYLTRMAAFWCYNEREEAEGSFHF